MFTPPPNPLRFFAYAHLPKHLHDISGGIADLAASMQASLPDSAEKSAGMRKLLEAKDCFVRAALDARDRQEEVAGDTAVKNVLEG